MTPHPDSLDRCAWCLSRRHSGMSDSLDVLLHLLDLEPLEVNIYRGQNRDLGRGTSRSTMLISGGGRERMRISLTA